MTDSDRTALRVRFGPGRPGVDHAARLLELLGARVVPDDSIDGLALEHGSLEHGSLGDRSLGEAGGSVVLGAGAPLDPATDWAASGAMWLTGTPGGPPLVAPGNPAGAARGAALAIEALTGSDPRLSTVAIDGTRLLGERAVHAGLRRQGRVSAGGSCRLVPAADALLAVNLPRRSDVELVPAWLGVQGGADPWASVVTACAGRSGTELVERAELLGLPVALVADPVPAGSHPGSRALDGASAIEPWRVIAPAPVGNHRAPGRVVDLSSMWAGPLCANLLGLAGFEVIKVESVSRPDGARAGPTGFYDLLHAGHRSVALDFSDPRDLASLRELMATADVVVESSRPRALDQLGLGPGSILDDPPRSVWVSITGYGRSGPLADRVAFGDDAAAGAGLVVSSRDGEPCFCGDALADPLTGVHAALACLAMWWTGTGCLVDVPLGNVAASVLDGPPRGSALHPDSAVRHEGGESWVIETADGTVPVAEPWSRPVTGRASPIGADNDLLV